MKNTVLSVTTALLLIATSCTKSHTKTVDSNVNSKEDTTTQSIEQQKSISLNRVLENEDITIQSIDQHTWHGYGNLCFNESVYLIEGDNCAMLIDAGVRMPGLRKIAEELVHNKPVKLYLSHLHSDHAGSAINEWDELWINSADLAMFPKFAESYKGKIHFMNDGEEIKLGNRNIDIVFTPGHTPGSTSFIDREAKYGFSADAFGSTNLLVFTNLSTEIATCYRMNLLIERYGITHLFPGHNDGDNIETPKRVKDVGEICLGIMNGQYEPKSVISNLNLVVEDRGVKINYTKDRIK